MEIKERLEEIEEDFDAVNPDKGSRQELCIYCKSKEYNSLVGIVHKLECPLYRLRQVIALL